MPEEYTARVIGNKAETPSVHVVTMKFSRPMSFNAGQWIYVYAMNGGKEAKKPYSIASPPSLMKESGILELCIKRVENGFMSNFLAGMKEGDELKVTGPYGVFGIKDSGNGKIFVATGSGVAPFRALIPELLETGFRKDVRLFLGVRKKEDIIYHSFFSRLQEEHENFHFIPILSREDWEGEKGHVQDVLPKYLKSPEGVEVYICGLIPMIDAVSAVLEKLGFVRTQMHFEKYI